MHQLLFVLLERENATNHHFPSVYAIELSATQSLLYA